MESEEGQRVRSLKATLLMDRATAGLRSDRQAASRRGLSLGEGNEFHRDFMSIIEQDRRFISDKRLVNTGDGACQNLHPGLKWKTSFCGILEQITNRFSRAARRTIGGCFADNIAVNDCSENPALIG